LKLVTGKCGTGTARDPADFSPSQAPERQLVMAARILGYATPGGNSNKEECTSWTPELSLTNAGLIAISSPDEMIFAWVQGDEIPVRKNFDCIRNSGTLSLCIG